MPASDSDSPGIDEIKSRMLPKDRLIFNLLSGIPQSSDDLHVRRSSRKAFIKWASHIPALQYISLTCIPDDACRFQPPRWRYGFKFTYEQALHLNQEHAPDGERLPPLSFYQGACHGSINPDEERLLVAGSWLESRVETILGFEHEVDWCLVWERGKKVQLFSFRDTWDVGNPLSSTQVSAISALMFGQYVEPMWYLDSDDCYWYEKPQ